MNDSCKMLIRCWDMERSDWKISEVNVPGPVYSGPTDNYLQVEGNIVPNKDGNFISNSYSEREIDAIHAFATARLTIELWEKAIGQKIEWGWRRDLPNTKLRLIPHGHLLDASCRYKSQTLAFGLSGPHFMPACRSLDMVAHETTHAIIESIRPGITDSGREARVVIESLADLTAMLLKIELLSDPTFLFQLRALDFRKRNIISEFGMGLMLQPSNGIRSAMQTFRFSKDIYKSSSRLTNLVYLEVVKKISRNEKNIFSSIHLAKLAKNIFTPILELREISSKNYARKMTHLL